MQARSRKGKWLLRIDDLDSPRNVPGAVDAIIKTLDHFGLHWDDGILFQSELIESYQEALIKLDRLGLLYPCVCSRKGLIRYFNEHPETKPTYPGFCRNKRINRNQAHALRIKTDNKTRSFSDSLQGTISQNLSQFPGDFIVKRRDLIPAYQLAVVIDDHNQQVTEVVRGTDLLDSTSQQIYLQQQLNLLTPDYMHVPVLIDHSGKKLSKQHGAKPVDEHSPVEVLFTLLQLLKQNPPTDLHKASANELLNWAILNWNPDPLKKIVHLKI